MIALDDDLQAAEFVLGTLAGAEREAFSRRAAAEPEIGQRITFWQNALQPLADAVAPAQPSAAVWAGVSRRLGFERGRRFLGMPLAAWATAVVILALGALLAPPVQQRLFFSPDLTVAILNEQQQEMWTIAADTRRNELRVIPVRDAPVAADRSLELWLLRPGAQAPVSLGLIPLVAEGPRVVRAGAAIGEGVGFAVSLEPRGGSPSGLPTGPVLYVSEFSA
jgi:anti-sigma-K factor RskA